jgi:hypothetical protein
MVKIQKYWDFLKYEPNPIGVMKNFVCLFFIFRHTQNFFSYMMAQFLLVEERTQIHYTMCFSRDHRPSVSKHFSHSHSGLSRIRTNAGWR